MRGFIAGILLFMAIASITSAAFPARALAADRQPPVIISLSRANEPYSFVSMFGEPSGLLVDIWRLWGEKVGRDVKFRMGEWQDLMADVRSGQSQIHGGLFRSSARSQVLDFGPALFPSRGVIIMASGVSADIENSPAPVIATLKGTILETFLRTRYPALRLLSLASFKDMIMAVGGGLAQGVAGPLLPLISAIDRLGLNEKFSTEPLPLIEDTLRPGVRKGDATTLELVEQGMAQIPRAELIALEEYWVRVPAMREINRVRRPLNLSPLERQWLESHSRWRVGFLKDGAPLAFTNKQGQFDGISADILRAVAGILGVEIVPHPEVSSRNLSADLATQQIDVVPFSERLPQVHENTYLRSLLFYLPLDVVTRANASFSVTSPSDLAKKTVAVLAYPGVAAQLEKLLPSAIVLVPPGLRTMPSMVCVQGAMMLLWAFLFPSAFSLPTASVTTSAIPGCPICAMRRKLPFERTGQSCPEFLKKPTKASPTPTCWKWPSAGAACGWKRKLTGSASSRSAACLPCLRSAFCALC